MGTTTKPKPLTRTDISEMLKGVGDATAEFVAEELRRKPTPSPSTLAAVRSMAARVSGMTIGEARELLSADEYAGTLRQRATVTNATGAPLPAWTKDVVALPEQGGRLSGLFRTRPAPHPSVGVGEEQTRAAVADAADFGADLPESSLSYTRPDIQFARLGAFVHAWKSILSDSQAVADAANYALNRDMGRQLDHELVAGDGSGTAFGTHFTGLAHLGLATQDASTSARWQAFVAAAGTVRGADWTGPIVTIIHPTDVVTLASDATSTDAPTFADALAALRVLGADNFALSSLATPGTAYTGSWSEFGTIYTREGEGPTIEIAQEADDDFKLGLVKIKIEGRLAFRAHHLTAGVQVVNL